MSLRTASLGLVLSTGVLLGQELSPKPAGSPTPVTAQVPSFPAEVELVTVDVVVTDKKGSPISGLLASDFQLTEDGAPQTITSFEAVELPAEPSPFPRRRLSVSTNLRSQERPWTGRSFAIVFDDIHLTPIEARKARAAVVAFLETSVRDGDRVSLVAPAAGVWWTTELPDGKDQLLALLKGLDGRRIPERGPDRLSDYEAMQIYLYRDPLVINRVMRRWVTYGVLQQTPERAGRAGTSGGSVNPFRTDEDPLIHGKAVETYTTAKTRNQATLQVLERLLLAMEGAKGRKAVILISPGFVFDSTLADFKDVLEASRRANAAIYSVDTRGLTGLPSQFEVDMSPAALPTEDIAAAFAETHEATAGSEHIALDSGGFVIKNTNDLADGIQRIADESRSYYLLGYHPANTLRDGAFREIEVKVDRKAVRVRARKGYYATADTAQPSEPPASGVDPRIQRAADAPFELEDVPLRATSYVLEETLLGRAKVLVVTDVDLRKFAFAEQADRFLDTLDFVLMVAHRETGEVFQQDQRVEMKLTAETRRRYDEIWFPVVQTVDLAPGGYQAKVVVRDKNAGAIGTVIHEFQVPDLGAFRTSTPVLGDRLETGREAGGPPRLALAARRSFPTGGMLYFQYDVYGAAPDPASRTPRIRAGYSIRRSDGTTPIRAEPTAIRPTSLGHLNRLSGARLESLAPGDYELVLTLVDDVAGKRLEVTEPFTLTGPRGG